MASLNVYTDSILPMIEVVSHNSETLFLSNTHTHTTLKYC